MSDQAHHTNWICGPFDREVAKLDESAVVHRAFRVLPEPARQLVMVDVGAHVGTSLEPFAASG